MKPHYICTGECKGMSATPGNCQTYGCTMYAKPLVACKCVDWTHPKEFQEETSASPVTETSQK